MPAVRSLILIFLIGCLAPLAATDGWSRLYPNATLVIDDITEGPDGFLWLATGNGIFRFDGFHYQKLPGTPFKSDKLIGVTQDGTVWVAGSEGLARCRNECTVIFRRQIWSMVAFPDKVIVTSSGQLMRFRLDGSMVSKEISEFTGSKFILEAPGGAVAMPGQSLRYFDADDLRERPGPRLSHNFAQATVDSRGHFWAGDKHRVELVGSRPARVYYRPVKETDTHQSLFSGRNGELWFAGETIFGLSTGRAFHEPRYDQYLATAVYEDKRGHLWVAKQGLGLMEWTPDSWQRWLPKNFGTDSPAQVVRTPDGAIVAVGHDLFRHNKEDTWTAITGKNRIYNFVLPLAAGGFLASIRDIGLARLSPTGDLIGSIPSSLANKTSYRTILEDRKGRIWSGNKVSLQRLDGPAAALQVVPLPNSKVQNTNAVDAGLDASGHVWVGYDKGLAWLDDHDNWHHVATSEPLIEVRSFALADSRGDDIWVAHRSQGKFSRLQRKNNIWQVTRFDAEAGYGPPATNFIKRDSRGWIWRGSTDGVHVSDGIHVRPEDWLLIGSANGLASDETDQYGFLEDRDGSVWITGDQGLTHLRPDTAWFSGAAGLPPPGISRIEVDGKSYPGRESLPADALKQAGVMIVDVGSLSASPFRHAPFRYRLKPRSDAWTLSTNGTLEFHDLRPQNYTLEVAYNAASHAATLTWNFRVGPPPANTWLWLLTLPGVALVAWLFREQPLMESLRFRVERMAFVLRRRLTPKRVRIPDTQDAGSDRSGELLAGRYKLLHVVSRGGFSVVHAAHDITTTELVAVKIISQEFGSEGWLRERFAHEVAALNSVRHPNIVPILDSWIEKDGSPCLVMPLLSGHTLAAELNAGPLVAQRVAGLTRAISAALETIHARGVVHRDLKPDNIILTLAGTAHEVPVLIDFGTAGLRAAPGQTSMTTVLTGSFHYMAPERLVGQYSAASDVYSLGVIVLEMITGKRLGEIGALATDPEFEGELTTVIEKDLGQVGAPAVAQHLAALFSPSPEKRPADVQLWGEHMAELLGRIQA